MKICVSSTGEDLNATVDERFGRCRYFIIVNTATMKINTLPNQGTISSSGAGVQAAQLITKQGVTSVITGNIGPKAFQILQVAGVQVFTGVRGVIKDAIERYKKGELKETGSANVQNYFGVGGDK
jgi:predicted Fe-Mo cluster-binding NifX family protein